MTSCGWLVTVGEDFSSQLINPLSCETINLPKVNTFDPEYFLREDSWYGGIRKLILLTSNNQSTLVLPLVVVSWDGITAMVCQPGISMDTLKGVWGPKSWISLTTMEKSLEGDNSRKDTTSSEIYETVRSEVRRAIAVIQDNLQDAIRRNTSAALVSTEVIDASKLVKPGAIGSNWSFL
ncbi:hypothetical protein Tco_0168010 [Tanacetum coccineum]